MKEEESRGQAPTAGEVIIVIGLITACTAFLIFFVWSIWTLSGMIMDYTDTIKYGWALQLVLTLIIFGLSGWVVVIGKTLAGSPSGAEPLDNTGKEG